MSNTNKLSLQNSFEIMQELFTNLNRGSGAMVISAADGEVTVSELRSYVTEQVQELTNGRQKPTSRQENVEFDFRVW